VERLILVFLLAGIRSRRIVALQKRQSADHRPQTKERDAKHHRLRVGGYVKNVCGRLAFAAAPCRAAVILLSGASTPQSGVWTTGSNLSTARSGSCAASQDGHSNKRVAAAYRYLLGCTYLADDHRHPLDSTPVRDPVAAAVRAICGSTYLAPVDREPARREESLEDLKRAS